MTSLRICPSVCTSFLLVGLLASGLATAAAPPIAQDPERLAYLNEPCDPYYVHRNFPRLITPQWVGESGVDAVVVLAIDDMRDPAKYETFLRPILNRLKAINGRAPVSIMTCNVKPDDPQLQNWIHEGLSLEVHTLDHPCPLLSGGDFAKSKANVDGCIDLMASIPGNRPVAFRTPCCDSLNTPSPRLFSEILGKRTPLVAGPSPRFRSQRRGGAFLQVDSSVFNLFTPNDPALPRDLVLEAGRERFRRYIPFPSFVNVIEDYPYPYVIDGSIWEFPCVIPSDWQAQNIQKPNNPRTVEDLKRALDATVVKQGVFNLVFHPHGWLRSDQIVELVDYADKKYGKRIIFLNFPEALERLNKNLLAGGSLRNREGKDAGVRILDINGDGYQDVLLGYSPGDLRTRIWDPKLSRWNGYPLPAAIVSITGERAYAREPIAFGNVEPGEVSLIFGQQQRAWKWTSKGWLATPGLGEFEHSRERDDQSFPKMALRDLDADGGCELILSNEHNNSVLKWNKPKQAWQKLSFTLPEGAAAIDDALIDVDKSTGSYDDVRGRDNGLRFVDINEDGAVDVVFSNEKEFGAYLFTDMQHGWSQKLRAGKRGDAGAIPAISRGGTNNGVFVHSRSLWQQNEDTARMPDLVDRLSFNDLLGDTPATARSPAAALKSFRLRPGFTIEQVATEPQVLDPVALDFGPDGKLWVVEMGDYPLGEPNGDTKPGNESKNAAAKPQPPKHNGQVRCLEDRDGDGRYETSTVFLDGLAYPNGVMAWKRGVLVTVAPDIIYAEDTDGDGRADRREVLYTGFNPGNPQHRINGPTWGLDNWIYLANGDSGGTVRSLKTGQTAEISGRDLRIRIQSGHADDGRLDPQSGMTQFGRACDDWGNWFGCNNPNPIWQYALADQYIRRNQHVIAPDSKRPLGRDMTIDRVYPISRTLARFNDLHTANRFTSCCGLQMYRDKLFGPDFADCWFVCEPVHNLVHRGHMAADACGFIARRDDDEQQSEFLSSTDGWFRPTMARVGFDGALYITDMYRAVIEHPEWIPDDWEKRLDLRAGSQQGRIYRIAPVGAPRGAMPRFDKLDTAGLVAALDSDNGPQRDLVHRMLLWRNDRAAVPLLEKMAADASRATARMQAICVLDGLNQLRPEILAPRLADVSPGVRRHAVRLTEGRVAGSPMLADAVVALATVPPLAPAAIKPHNLPANAPTEALVQLQLAYSLGEWNDPRAGRLLGAVLARNAEDPYITAAAMSSVNAKNIDMVLATVLAGVDGRAPSLHLAGRLFVLAATLGSEDALVDVLKQVTAPATAKSDSPYAPWQFAALAGCLEEFARRQTSLDQMLAADRTTAANVTRMFDHARKLVDVFDPQAAASPTTDKSDANLAAAARLLGFDAKARAADVARLAKLVVPQSSAELQQTAIASLARMDDPAVANALLSSWPQLTPALRRSVVDTLISRDRWALRLVEEVAAARISPSEFDAARRQRLLAHRDGAVRDRAAKLFAAIGDRARVVAQFQDLAKTPGDAPRGAGIFTRKCAACHRLGGAGHAVGADLAALTNRSTDALLVAILDPNRAVEDKFIGYAVRTVDGRQLTGILASESGNSITLASQDGKTEALLRTDIDELKTTGKSFMPEGLEKDLPRQELADVIAYLQTLGPPPKSFEGNRPRTIEPAADGTLSLAAADAAIFGPTLVFEQQHANLGYWMKAADYARWTLSVARAGRYRVRLEYACDNSSAGNELVLESGAARLAVRVEGTSDWDTYRTIDLGTLDLAAGEQTLIARPAKEPQSAILDLKRIVLEPMR